MAHTSGHALHFRVRHTHMYELDPVQSKTSAVKFSRPTRSSQQQRNLLVLPICRLLLSKLFIATSGYPHIFVLRRRQRHFNVEEDEAVANACSWD